MVISSFYGFPVFLSFGSPEPGVFGMIVAQPAANRQRFAAFSQVFIAKKHGKRPEEGKCGRDEGGGSAGNAESGVGAQKAAEGHRNGRDKK